jgi:hypothetical protein
MILALPAVDGADVVEHGVGCRITVLPGSRPSNAASIRELAKSFRQ